MATPERLVGSDLVAVTQKVVDAQRAALPTPTAAQLICPYAHDVVFNDYASGMHGKGRAAGLRAFRKNVESTGVSRQTIISIERGRYNPSLELAWKLSRMLGVTIEELFCFTEGD